MRNISLLLIALSLVVCSTAMAATIAGDSAYLAILHPEKWGLDSLITSVLTAVGVFIVGWFTHPPRGKKK